MELDELTAALAPLVATLDDLAESVRDVGAEAAQRDAATKRALDDRAREGKEAERRQVRRTRWIGAGVVLLLLAVGLMFFVASAVRLEGKAGRDHFDCALAVLFRQDPPSCPMTKEDLIRRGILPPGFPATTTTTR